MMKEKLVFQICGFTSLLVVLALLSKQESPDRYITFSTTLTSMEERKRHYADISEGTGRNVFDQRQLPSASHSKLSIATEDSNVKIGKFIRVEILIRDGFGRAMTRGGDAIICWMTNKRNRASLAGSVVDHMNGSYTGIIRAMWAGSAMIKCAIGCTREGFHMMVDYFKQHGTSKQIFCIFENNKHKVRTIGLTSVLNDSNVCNLTAENYGIPWYCVRPDVTGVQCSDWTKLSHEDTKLKALYNERSSILYYSRSTAHSLFTDTIDMTVKSEPTPADVAPSRCTRNDLADTWSWPSPVGFFYNNTWRLTHCRLNDCVDYTQCLKNRRMVLYGDSTVRQWFFRLFNQLELKFSTPVWNVTKWHRQSVAFKEQYNFTLVWTRHGLPIYFGETNRGETRPVYSHLDQIQPGANDIILINLYAHFQYHDPVVFRRNLRTIVFSVRSLLRRSPDVRIAVKGSHYFSFRDRRTLGGMWGRLYDGILKEEFRGLYAKVHFIDVWDMTVARENRDVHPLTTLVKSMLHVFLSYACS